MRASTGTSSAPTRNVTTHDRGVVDGVQERGRLVVVRRAAVPPSPAPASPAPRRPPRRLPGRTTRSTRPACPRRAGRPGRESRTSDAAGPQAGGQRVDERGHAARRATRRAAARRGRARDLGPQRPHEAAAALGGRQQRREGRRGRHVVDRAGVDAADQRVDQRVDDTPAELVRHERADGTVADRPAGVGPGQQGVAGEAERRRGRRGCRSGRWARTGSGCRARGPRAAGAAARGPTPTRHGRRWARARPPSPTSRHRSTASGRRPRKPSGPMSTTRPPNVVALQRAAEARRGLEHDDGGRVGRRRRRHRSAPRPRPGR